MERLRALVFQHVDNEHLGYMGSALEEQGVDVHVINFSQTPFLATKGYYPVETVQMLIVLGGPMGVNDSEKVYLSKAVELATIKRAIFKAKVPVWGICLGSQLIAKALEARVYKNTYEGISKKEIGYYDVPLTFDGENDPLFKDLKSPLRVLQWHGDAFTLPKGAKRLATSLYCENQAFVYKQSLQLADKENGALAYGLLFHKEFTPGMVRQQIINDKTWIHEDPRDDVDEDHLIELADKNAHKMEKEARILVKNMVSIVRERQLAKAA